MARGKTLLSLLDDLRAECRISLNPAQNAQARETHVKLLQRVQDTQYEDFAWPHLRVERRLLPQAGQRYYSLPSDIDMERISHIEVRYGQEWCPLMAGIGPGNYAERDSDRGETSYPIQSWRIWEDDQIELWPIPEADATSTDGEIKIVGIRKLKPLRDDADTADLDDRLIVLFAAAEILGGVGAKDAAFKLDAAKKRLETLRGHLTPRRVIPMFGNDGRGKGLRGPPRVHYRVEQVQVPGGGGGGVTGVIVDGGREG